ncbi:PAS domain S-box protein [Martelella alba]|nr:PAS domain S-box protein [Martelella alba]
MTSTDGTPGGMRDTIDAAPETVVITALDGRIEIANEAAILLFGQTEERLRGMMIADLFAMEYRDQIQQCLERAGRPASGYQLEEFEVRTARPPIRAVKVSLARMKHREGLCVIVQAAPMPQGLSAVTESEPEKPSSVWVYNRDARQNDAVQQVSAKPAPVSDATGINSSIVPDKDSANIAAKSPLPSLDRAVEAPVARAPMPDIGRDDALFAASTSETPASRQAEPPRQPAWSSAALGVSEPVPRKVAQEAAANRAAALKEAWAKAEVAQRTTAPPPQLSRRGPAEQRDLYAEFESVREQKRKVSELPKVKPAKALRSSFEAHRLAAAGECVHLVARIDDGIGDMVVDELALRPLFDLLIERLIAVSPLYCDAEITMDPVGDYGFVARFKDIGRGLSEDELALVGEQPDLSTGFSHTAIARARVAVDLLGGRLAIDTAIEKGTTITVTLDA